jgi:hypothetical protein
MAAHVALCRVGGRRYAQGPEIFTARLNAALTEGKHTVRVFITGVCFPRLFIPFGLAAL